MKKKREKEREKIFLFQNFEIALEKKEVILSQKKKL